MSIEITVDVVDKGRCTIRLDDCYDMELYVTNIIDALCAIGIFDGTGQDRLLTHMYMALLETDAIRKLEKEADEELRDSIAYDIEEVLKDNNVNELVPALGPKILATVKSLQA